MQEEQDGSFVHFQTFGKGSGLSYDAPDTPSRRAVEAFEVVGGAALVGLGELVLRDDVGISVPNIGEAVRAFIGRRNATPQHTARRLTATTQSIGHDLAGAPAQRQPQPLFVFALVNPCPHLIQFQLVPRRERQKCFLKRRQLRHFF